MSRRGAGAALALAGVLLVPALVLTAVRLSPLQAGPALRVVAFTPFALPVYVVALVLLLLAAALRGSGRRRLPLGGALLALAGLGLHGWWAGPMWLGDTPAPAAGSTPLTVMTANLFLGGADPRSVVDAVREEGVDLLVLEEVSTELLPALDAAGLAELLPHRIGEPDPDDPVNGTLVLSTQPLGEPTPVDTYHQSWLVDVGEGASALTLLAVHPVSPVDAPRWRREHALLVQTAEQAQPDLVVGDFNATADHRPVRALDDAGFRDAARLADSGWQPTWPANGLGSPAPTGLLPPVVAIDHVLVGRGWTALSTRTHLVADTDHLALLAEVAPR